MTPGTGSRRRNQIRVTIGFDSDTAARLRELAKQHRSTLAEAVRTAVEWGLPEEGGE